MKETARLQLERYIDTIYKETGALYQKGDPRELITGETIVGSVWEATGPLMERQFNVIVYPGKDAGILFYKLSPTGQERFQEDLKKVGVAAGALIGGAALFAAPEAAPALAPALKPLVAP